MLHDVAHTVAPFIWGGVAIAMITLRHRRKMAQIGATPDRTAPVTNEQTREIEHLRDRIRVLERIATDQAADERRQDSGHHDSGRVLAARIEALRD